MSYSASRKLPWIVVLQLVVTLLHSSEAWSVQPFQNEHISASFTARKKSCATLIQQWKQHIPPLVCALCLSLSPCAAVQPALAEGIPQEWDLMNGYVSLEDPISLQYMSKSGVLSPKLQLAKPRLIGAGGGGAVFSFDQSQDSERDLLLKISWEGSAKTVQRECQTLQLLEDKNVQAAERCRGTLPYPSDPKRVMILVEPYMRDAVASISEVPNKAEQKVAVDQIVRTLVQMLAANIVTIDVQPLISKTTGQTIFIDMTEAQVLSSSKEYSFLDKTLISSFCSEMVALVPEPYWPLAKESILDEMAMMKQRGSELTSQAMEVLEDQTPFFSD